MLRRVLCCLAVAAFAPVQTSGQRAPARQPTPPYNRPLPGQPSNRPAPTPPYNRPAPGQVPARPRPATPAPRDNAAGDSGPVRPDGFKPITLKTAQMENERLAAAIEKLQQRLKAKEDDDSTDAADDADGDAEKASATLKGNDATAGEAAGDEKAAAASDAKSDTKPDEKPARAKRPTLARVVEENRSLRRQVDALLVKVAAVEGTIPERPAGLPKYDPHVIDSPTNADFCPGKTLEQLEDTMRFAGFPVGESEDGGVCYEWIFHITKAERKAHATLRIWAIMKDGVAAETKQAAPGVAKEGPPPKFTPTR